MSNSVALSDDRPSAPDPEIWESLKQAIAATPGFTCWRLEQGLTRPLSQDALDEQVRAYLRETLETLAY